MLRLARLILIVLVAASLVSGSVGAMVVIANGFLHHSATAVETKLPPLSTELWQG